MLFRAPPWDRLLRYANQTKSSTIFDEVETGSPPIVGVDLFRTARAFFGDNYLELVW